ncbi:MAG: hypothetical protein U9P44_00170 [archaeon]|nr:hypothetical protein [archaeon]
MAPIEIISAVLGIMIIFKGLAIMLAPKKFERWTENYYIKNKHNKWIMLTIGFIIMYYAIENMPLLNIFSLVVAFGFIANGFLLNFPKELKEISKKTMKDRTIKMLAPVAVFTGLLILYIILV